MASKPSVIECSFNLFDEGRKYSGQHRKYVTANAREICYAPETRERIKLREALGYYGHGRRILCGKMNLQEVDVINLPDGGQAMVSNVPSNVTIAFDVDEKGNVTHKQEILDTDTGKIVASLNASKIGGFSWACPAEDGGSTKATKLTGFSGFDYVLQPGFSHNRGYVLENAGNREQLILESVSAVVKDEDKARQLVNGWRISHARDIEALENAVFESENAYYTLQSDYDTMQKNYREAIIERDRAFAETERYKSNFRGVLENIGDVLPFFIPESAMHAMMEGDFTRAKAIFESAIHIDYSQYPLAGNLQRKPVFVPVTNDEEIGDSNPLLKNRFEPPEFGSAEYGLRMNL